MAAFYAQSVAPLGASQLLFILCARRPAEFRSNRELHPSLFLSLLDPPGSDVLHVVCQCGQ